VFPIKAKGQARRESAPFRPSPVDFIILVIPPIALVVPATMVPMKKDYFFLFVNKYFNSKTKNGSLP
jgi:hypothetical protein